MNEKIINDIKELYGFEDDEQVIEMVENYIRYLERSGDKIK